MARNSATARPDAVGLVLPLLDGTLERAAAPVLMFDIELMRYLFHRPLAAAEIG
jgi:hypothetical protein